MGAVVFLTLLEMKLLKTIEVQTEYLEYFLSKYNTLA